MMQKPKRYVTQRLRKLTANLDIEIQSICNDMLKKGCVLQETITIAVDVMRSVEVILIFAEY